MGVQDEVAGLGEGAVLLRVKRAPRNFEATVDVRDAGTPARDLKAMLGPSRLAGLCGPARFGNVFSRFSHSTRLAERRESPEKARFNPNRYRAEDPAIRYARASE